MDNKEQIDFSNTLIKDLDLFSTSQNVLKFLKKLNIVTLNDLFNCEDIYMQIIDSKLTPRTKEAARALIRLARYKYLNEPLTTDVTLENNIIYFTKDGIQGFDFGAPLEIFGFTKHEKERFISYLMSQKEKRQYKEENNGNLSFGKIIDLFKYFYDNRFSHLLDNSMIEKIELYLSSYKENHEEKSNLLEEIAFFRNYINNMKQLRDEYNRKIIEAEKKLKELEQEKQGGTK